jgi:hypothetical protein
VIAEVLDRYDEVGIIDDAAFARAWVSSRHHGRGLARRALANELRQHGVDAEVASEALETLDDDAEAATARALVDRKLRTATGHARGRCSAGWSACWRARAIRPAWRSGGQGRAGRPRRRGGRVRRPDRRRRPRATTERRTRRLRPVPHRRRPVRLLGDPVLRPRPPHRADPQAAQGPFPPPGPRRPARRAPDLRHRRLVPRPDHRRRPGSRADHRPAGPGSERRRAAPVRAESGRDQPAEVHRPLAPIAQGWLPQLSGCSRSGEPRRPGPEQAGRRPGSAADGRDERDLRGVRHHRRPGQGSGGDARAERRCAHPHPWRRGPAERAAPSGRTTGNYVEYAYQAPSRTVSGRDLVGRRRGLPSRPTCWRTGRKGPGRSGSRCAISGPGTPELPTNVREQGVSGSVPYVPSAAES